MKRCVAFAAGGTGGHIFPAIAVAEALKQQDPLVNIVFFGNPQGLECQLVQKAGFMFLPVRIRGLKGKSILDKLKALLMLPFAIVQSMRLLKTHGVGVVLGTGGYVSGPVLLGAFLLRIPFAICEPNSISGFTNRVLGRFAFRVFGSFESTRPDYPKNRYELAGTPLRAAIACAVRKPTKTTHIAVLGGSLGASAINQIMPEVFYSLKDQGYGVYITHQTGEKEAAKVRENYQQLNIQADVKPFIHNIEEIYASVTLLICRSGAITCAEICALGVPAILIPFPFAIDDHQTVNAKQLVHAGAAFLMPQSELSVEGLSKQIRDAIDNPEVLSRMSQNALVLGHPKASAHIAYVLSEKVR